MSALAGGGLLNPVSSTLNKAPCHRCADIGPCRNRFPAEVGGFKRMHHIVEVDLGGRKITLETGKMAKQANGAVVVRSGDSVVLVTACMADQAKPGAGFL